MPLHARWSGPLSQPALDLGYEDDPADPTYSVRELADAVNDVLQRGFRDGVWVRGEIQGLQERGNGHIWFNLTEDGDEGKATVSVVLFAGTAGAHAAVAAAPPDPAGERHRRAHPRPARLLRHRPGAITLVMDQLDARFTLGPAGGPARPAAARPGGRGPARPEPSAAAAARAAAGRGRHQPRQRRLARLPGRAAPQRVRLPRSGSRDVRVQGEGAEPASPRRIEDWAAGAQPPSTSIVAHPGRRRPHRPGHVRHRGGRPGHRRVPGAGAAPGSATRSTAASPTRSPTPR